MQSRHNHISDENLLLFSDQELPLRQAAMVREHIARCLACRERLTSLEAASADFSDFHERTVQTESPHSSNLRNLLQARLSEACMQHGRSQPAAFANVLTRQLASACLALLLVVGCTWAARQMIRTGSNSDVTTAEAMALPRRALTPGSVRTVPIAELCHTEELENDPPVTPSIEQAVFQEYGVPASSTKNYALDYLITPELGGGDNIQNLWPQPYSATWNARVKDQLEDHLHEMVCQGKVQLTTAQNDIATDWIAAYKRYFNTDRPTPDTSTSARIHRSYEFDPNHHTELEARVSHL